MILGTKSKLEEKTDQAAATPEEISEWRSKAWQHLVGAINALNGLMEELKWSDSYAEARKLGRAITELNAAFDYFDKVESEAKS